jgi:hypothetical protein
MLKMITLNPTLGGNVSTINEIRRTFGGLVWGDVDTIGYRFELRCKVQINET